MEAPKRTEPVAEGTRTGEGLHLCPSCGSEMVQPVEWFEQGGGHWHVELRCPECEWWARGTFNQREVDDFDEKLDSGAQALLEDLRALTRSNMEQEIESFAAALCHDRILPEDF
jgi:hypothetical protein